MSFRVFNSVDVVRILGIALSAGVVAGMCWVIGSVETWARVPAPTLSELAQRLTSAFAIMPRVAWMAALPAWVVLVLRRWSVMRCWSAQRSLFLICAGFIGAFVLTVLPSYIAYLNALFFIPVPYPDVFLWALLPTAVASSIAVLTAGVSFGSALVINRVLSQLGRVSVAFIFLGLILGAVILMYLAAQPVASASLADAQAALDDIQNALGLTSFAVGATAIQTGVWAAILGVFSIRARRLQSDLT